MHHPKYEESQGPRRRQDCKLFRRLYKCSTTQAPLIHSQTVLQSDTDKGNSEDGTIDHSSTAPRATNTHRLGPRANQGVINEKLRALDRSGKPCRKWSKSGFQMKSFTGVVWDMPRWKAPPKVVVEGSSETQSISGDSSKENKDNSQQPSVKSEKSNSNGDVEMSNGTVENIASPASSLPGPQDITTSNIPVPVEA